jgi:hypothetical protein
METIILVALVFGQQGIFFFSKGFHQVFIYIEVGLRRRRSIFWFIELPGSNMESL